MNPLVVLDLNGVLLDSTHQKRLGVAEDARARFKYVYFRPGLKEFLDWLFALPGVDVGIWTSNKRENADAIVNLILSARQREKLAFVYSRSECVTFPDYSSEKPANRLFALGYDPRRTIFIDDSDDKISHPLKHLFYHKMPEYVASPITKMADCELLHLKKVISKRFLSPE